MSNTNSNESAGTIRPSVLSGKVSKAKLVQSVGHVTATVNGPSEPNAAERDALFDQAVATTRGLNLSDASQNLSIVGDQVFDSNSGELLNEIKPSNAQLITPSVRNSAFKDSGRVGSPSINKTEPSHKVGSRTTAIPEVERVAEPASPIAPGSDVDKRLTAIETALATLLEITSK